MRLPLSAVTPTDLWVLRLFRRCHPAVPPRSCHADVTWILHQRGRDKVQLPPGERGEGEEGGRGFGQGTP